MVKRYELTDDEYVKLEPLLPSGGGRGRPWSEHRAILNGIFWKLFSGAAWRDVPERYGPWETIYSRYTNWRKDGTWDRMVEALQVELDADGHIDWVQWSIDSTSVRANRSAAGARKKGGQKATNRQTMD